MPRRDGTGPQGAGPMTGRGAGRCAGGATPGYAKMNVGRGFCGRGFGFGGGGGGRGRRNWFYATGLPGWMRFGGGVQGASALSPSSAERGILQDQAEMLQQQLNGIKKRLDAMAVHEETLKP